MKTLALTTKVQNGVKPPAKKHEVIAAMAQVKLEQLRAARAEVEAAAVQAEQAAKAALDSYIREKMDLFTTEPSIGYHSCDGHVKNVGLRVEVIFENLPKPLKKLIEKAHKAKDDIRSVRVPEFTVIKRQIAAAMVGETAPDLRVKALVETPETRKAIEKMLVALEPPKQVEVSI